VDRFSTVSHSITSGLTMPSCSHKCGLARYSTFCRGSRNYESPCITYVFYIMHTTLYYMLAYT